MATPSTASLSQTGREGEAREVRLPRAELQLPELLGIDWPSTPAAPSCGRVPSRTSRASPTSLVASTENEVHVARAFVPHVAAVEHFRADDGGPAARQAEVLVARAACQLGRIRSRLDRVRPAMRLKSRRSCLHRAGGVNRQAPCARRHERAPRTASARRPPSPTHQGGDQVVVSQKHARRHARISALPPRVVRLRNSCPECKSILESVLPQSLAWPLRT